MKIAYIIHAYKSPEQLKILVKQLQVLPCDFYIHIDKKSDIAPFKDQLKQFSNIHWVRRVKCKWGHLSTVRATLFALREALQSPQHYDIFQFLSGQDFPIKPSEEIANFYQTNIHLSFVEHFQLPSPELPDGWRYRTEFFHFFFAGKRCVFDTRTSRLTMGGYQVGLNFFPFNRIKRKAYEQALWGGSFYLTLSRQAATDVFNYVQQHKQFLRFNKYNFIPEELFYQTCLLNGSTRGNIVNKSLTFVDWSEGGASPKIFDCDDLEKLINQDKLYARKFDLSRDKEILYLITLHTIQNESC
jgi:hypothetical protein